jgi:hypothetical protein
VTVALVVVTDGRYHYLEQMLGSLAERVPYPFGLIRVVDDSGTPEPPVYPPGWDVTIHPQRRGLAAAVQSAWRDLPAEIDYVFHVEEDFVFVAPVDIDAMALTLKEQPRLAQVVLKRQPWSPAEREAGGIIEMHPDLYSQQDTYVEHRRIFSLNPCLIPRAVVDLGWPAGNEAGFTEQLVEAGWSFGFWGQKTDPPRVLHVGVERSAGWTL